MNRSVLSVVLLALLTISALIYFIYMNDKQKATQYQKAEEKVMKAQGEEHHGWTPFYYAKSGTWKILDEAAYVLKEMKFTSSDRDTYTVYKLESGGIVRTIESRGRWKKVEVLVDGRVAATGWIDAHFVRNVEEVSLAVNDE